jgi:hypothetical protein|tara:strand:+ start:458 stop:631 length:174 start_codon:yes stop_codon:yes gene_type:complete
MIKQYPYMVTYRLSTTGNQKHHKRLTAGCATDAEKLFEESMPSASIVCTYALPQNRV